MLEGQPRTTEQIGSLIFPKLTYAGDIELDRISPPVRVNETLTAMLLQENGVLPQQIADLSIQLYRYDMGIQGMVASGFKLKSKVIRLDYDLQDGSEISPDQLNDVNLYFYGELQRFLDVKKEMRKLRLARALNVASAAMGIAAVEVPWILLGHPEMPALIPEAVGIGVVSGGIALTVSAPSVISGFRMEGRRRDEMTKEFGTRLREANNNIKLVY